MLATIAVGLVAHLCLHPTSPPTLIPDVEHKISTRLTTILPSSNIYPVPLLQGLDLVGAVERLDYMIDLRSQIDNEEDQNTGSSSSSSTRTRTKLLVLPQQTHLKALRNYLDDLQESHEATNAETIHTKATDPIRPHALTTTATTTQNQTRTASFLADPLGLAHLKFVRWEASDHHSGDP